MASLVAILSGAAVTGALMVSAINDPSSDRAGRIAAVVPQVMRRSVSAYREKRKKRGDVASMKPVLSLSKRTLAFWSLVRAKRSPQRC